MQTFSLILHVTAAALLVGPQLLMFFAVVPATWLIEDDERLKRALLRVIAGRFGMLATFAIVVLVITGVYQYATIVPKGVRDSSTSRFGLIFSIKMMMFFLVMVMIGVHTRLYGRRIARLSDEVIALESDPSSARREEGRARAVQLERARTQSFTFSALILVASLITLWLGVALGDESFSWAQR